VCSQYPFIILLMRATVSAQPSPAKDAPLTAAHEPDQ
jgi:hypothetical protein